MKAKRYLLEYRRCKARIARLQSEIQKLEDLCSGLTAPPMDGDKVQSSHEPDKIGAVVAQKADLEDELMDEVLNGIDALNSINGTINLIEDVDYQRILELRYVCFDLDTLRLKTWHEIAAEMNYSERWIQTLHGKALWEVEKIITERRLI